MRSTRVPQAVLLDAFGTIVGLDRPVERLAAGLRDAGHDAPLHRVRDALHAEMAYYRENLDDGRDATSLADLRSRCTDVLARGLGGDCPPREQLAGLLLQSLTLVLLPDTLDTLDALARRGVRLAVVSNYDCSLATQLARLGIASRFEVISVSAVLGVAKPDPAIFGATLDALGVAPTAALHCGDRPERDCAGARAAGIPAVIIDRDGVHADDRCPRIRDLRELAGLVGTPR